MAGRLPFNLQGHPGQNALHDAQIRAALGLGQVDEALFLQQQRELQRDLQLRQMLLHDHLGQQSRLDSLVAEQRLNQLREQMQEFPELQQQYSLLLRERLQREQEAGSSFLARAQLQQQQDELQRRALAQSQAQTQQQTTSEQQSQSSATTSAGGTGTAGNVQAAARTTIRDIAADSLAGNAVKRGELEKRVFAKPDEDVMKKRPRSGTEDSGDGDRKRKKKRDKTQTLDDGTTPSALAELGNAAMEITQNSSSKPSVQALLDFASSAEMKSNGNRPAMQKTLGTLGDLLNAAESEKKTDDAVSILTGIKGNKKEVHWSDSETENPLEVERRIAIRKGDTIDLPNFKSILPQLPEEPEFIIPDTDNKKKRKKKHKSLLDDDSVDTKAAHKSKSEKRETKEASAQAKTAEPAVDVPFSLDAWWPSVASIRKERRSNGENPDEDDFENDAESIEGPFKANMSKLRSRFANEVAPGVLEKIPHCRIHRMLMKKRKNPSAPEYVHCFQVTELYPNDIMVCCSHCGTWRHAACGGHHKPYSIRECIDAPFTAVCDRCHEEEKILRDFPIARKRIDRQRSEQIRRGLATSAAMRQASFSKHGGTYKWPLGSVSATHIGGHTRSVHHRHDKAEKQWMDMSQRLNKQYGYRPKERIKIRTKELERLLVSVEDAEGHTDRHNMMLFLLLDTLNEHPSGFEKQRRNIFDPEEDEVGESDDELPEANTNGSVHEVSDVSSISGEGRAAAPQHFDAKKGAATSFETNGGVKPRGNAVCIRKDCEQRPRFDSLFCSDSCGVACLEGDLLRTFQYTSDMHPSMFRH